MEKFAPDNIVGPNWAIEEDKVVPEDPGDVAEHQREDEVLVHGHTTTWKCFEYIEEEKWEKQAKEGGWETHNRKSVDIIPEFKILVVNTIGVVGPGPVGGRMDPPGAILITKLVSKPFLGIF